MGIRSFKKTWFNGLIEHLKQGYDVVKIFKIIKILSYFKLNLRRKFNGI